MAAELAWAYVFCLIVEGWITHRPTRERQRDLRNNVADLPRFGRFYALLRLTFREGLHRSEWHSAVVKGYLASLQEMSQRGSACIARP